VTGEPEQSAVRPTKPDLTVEVRVRELNEADAAPGACLDPFVHHGSAAKEIESWGVLAAVLVIAGVYTWVHIGRGWVPADDGTLSQSALRVMQGQLPHRDFGEIYTGGLSFIHALAFRAFGVNLMSLRICVFLFFLAWIPAVYYVALRFTSALSAGAITLLAVAWSYPNYPAAMPSWYNLFFATFGAAALLRYLETRTRRWLFVAGVCGGVSILIKVIGAYYVAAVLLSLAFDEQSESSEERSQEVPAIIWPYRVFSVGALLLFLATVIYTLHARLGIDDFYHFVLPSAGLVGLILLGERSVQADTGQRFRTILGTVVPFLCGVAGPIIIFLVPYARSGTLWKILFGVSSSVISRSVVLGVIRPAGTGKILFALALTGLVAAPMYWREFQGRVVGATVGLGLTAMLLKAATSGEIVTGVWYSVATLTPLVVLAGAAVLLTAGTRTSLTRSLTRSLTKLQRQRVMVLISLAALCSLVQYPFASPIYLCYTTPLTLLAAVAIVVTARKHAGTYVLAAIVGFYLLFGVVRLVPDYIYAIFHEVGPMAELQLSRGGGLQIEYAANFAELARFLQQHSPNGLIFAGNDCPELYFLSGLKNISYDDGGAAAEEMLQAIQSDNLNLVVINDAPLFPSAVVRPEVRAEVMKRFPHSARFGIFLVFWKQ